MRFGIRELILLGVLLAMPVASYVLVFQPQNDQIEQAQREIIHKTQMLEKLREATSRSEDLARANEQVAKSIRAIESRLPTRKEVDGIVRQVSDLALSAGLSQPQISTEKPIRAALYMEQPLKMSVKGDFRGFYEFLLRLEQLARITRMPSLKIDRDPDLDGSMRAEFTLSIYFQPNESESNP